MYEIKCHLNNLARNELACVLREGLMFFMYNISYTKQSSLLLLHLHEKHRTFEYISTVKNWLTQNY